MTLTHVFGGSSPSCAAKHGVVMSRSYRKTPIFGFTNATSEKKDKQIWHKRMRHAEHQKLSQIPMLKIYTHEQDPELEDILDETFGHYSCPFCNHYDWYDFGGYDHLTTTEKEACDVWSMAKDGKYYMNSKSLLRYVEWKSDYKGRNYGEGRILHRLFAK